MVSKRTRTKSVQVKQNKSKVLKTSNNKSATPPKQHLSEDSESDINSDIDNFDEDDDEDLLKSSFQNNEIEDDDDDETEEEEEEEEEGVDEEDDVEDDDDDEDVEDEEADSEDENEISSKIPKTKESVDPLYALPTAQELIEMDESLDMFHSNLFKLEIEELLKEIKVEDKKSQKMHEILNQFKVLIDQLKDESPVSVSQANKTFDKSKISIPYPNPTPSLDANYQLNFLKPSNITVIGGFPLGLTPYQLSQDSKPSLYVDLAVHLPSTLFQPKDFVNYRYFYKKAYYLACLAKQLSKTKSDLKFNFKYEFLHQSDLSPILVAQFHIKSSVRFFIRLFPTINHDIFKLSRFSPVKHNIRLHSQSEQETGPATPYYNTQLACDTLLVPHTTFLHQFTNTSPEFATAVQLGKIWLQQRSIGKGGLIGKGFNGFVFAMILAHLLRPSSAGGKLSRGFSSFQLFRGAVDYLAQLDITKDPIVIGRSQDQVNFSLESFTSVFPVIILDPTGTVNLVPHLSLNDWKLIQSEFKQTSLLLSDKKVDHFSNIFLTDLVKNPLARFDHVIKLNSLTLSSEQMSPSQSIEFEHNSLLLQSKLVPELLKKGLTDRVDHIVSYFVDPLPFDISAKPSDNQDFDLFVGLILDSQHSGRLVDRGPSPQDVQLAEEFRKLWGDKAELRRFQDGSIVESVVWKADHLKDRQTIVPTMVKYLLKRHYQTTAQSLVYWANQLTKYIDLSDKSYRGKREHKLSTKGFQPFIDQMDHMIKTMKKLTTVPLDIVTSTGLSAAYKNTSVFYPTPVDLKELAQLPTTCRFIQSHDVNFELELSSEWPDDLVAIQRLKSAFYSRIASELNDKGDRYNCKVVHRHINRNLPEICVSSYLAVWTSAGYLFRCFIYHPKELDLLLAGTKDTKLSRLELEQYDKALTMYNQRFVYHPFLAVRIHTLCLKHTSMSTLIRVVKRWLASHLLTNYVNDWVVELLCSYIYVHHGSLPTPHSVTTAFYRFLHLIAQFDFKNSPLIIDYDQDMSIKFRQDAEDKFNSKFVHGTQPHPGMAIVTKIDAEGTCFLDASIPKPVISRLKRLAQAGLQCLKSVIDQTEAKGCDQLVDTIFTTSTEGYDFVLDLNVEHLTRYFQNRSLNSEHVEASVIKSDQIEPINPHSGEFDPVEMYLELLKNTYKDQILFFNDPLGGNRIGGLFNPHYFNHPISLKVNLGFNFVVHDVPSSQVNGNREAVLGEIVRLGEGLVDKVHVSN